MKLSDARQSAIRTLLISEKLPTEAIEAGLRGVLDREEGAVRDPIGLARFLAKQWRPAPPEAPQETLYPCRTCGGTGFEEVTAGITAGGVPIRPDDRQQMAVRKCSGCHGMRHVRLAPEGGERKPIHDRATGEVIDQGLLQPVDGAAPDIESGLGDVVADGLDLLHQRPDARVEKLVDDGPPDVLL